jgi:putative transposase
LVHQLSLPLGNTWGGKRRGAGRKPSLGRAGDPHTARGAHSRHRPAHVTVRVRAGLPSLRSQSLFRCVLAQIHAAKRRFLRIVHFSVQSNHIHLLVEAADQSCVTRGMKGFAVRVARRLNSLLASRGTIFGDRYHARALKTPREVRNALVYVIFNHKKHGRTYRLDPCSSASYFDGWSDGARLPGGSVADWPVAPGETWLLKHGWKRRGSVGPDDGPCIARPGAHAGKGMTSRPNALADAPRGRKLSF